MVKKKHKQKAGPRPTIMGVAWYERDEWNRLLEVAADPDSLEPSYDEWKTTAESAMAKLAAAGLVVVQETVRVAELVRWCEDRGRPVDAEARAAFVTAKLAGGDADKA